MKRGRRLRAPRDDRGVLVEPPWPALISQFGKEGATTRRSYDVSGISLDRLTNEAREELLRQAVAYTKSYRDVPSALSTQYSVPSARLVLAGHQPELFHPGVWAKNFALSAIAKAVDAGAVNLVIDGDVLRTPTIRVPTGSVDAPHVETVPFDVAEEDLPYEERRVRDADLFASFGERAAVAVRPLIAEPLLKSFWPAVVEETRRDGLLGAAIARARHRWEGTWGLDTLELPQSRMCELPSFHRFAAHLLGELPRFHAAHNAALAEYRRIERVRGVGRPVPSLTCDEDFFEAPFWLWTADDPRRRRIFLRAVGGELELTDRADLSVRLPRSEARADRLAAALAELPSRGIRLRSRALLTTMFARAIVAAPFIHGIGGGKYDELTDEIVRRFFLIEPPPFAVVTATRHLPIERARPAIVPPSALRHRICELDFHPEAFLDETCLEPEARARAEQLRVQKRRLLADAPSAGSTRRWCQAIRSVNAELRPLVTDLRRAAEEKLRITCRQLDLETVLSSREYSSFLFPEKDLREFLLALVPNKR